MNWINIKEKLPNNGEYVLLETPHCKYPCCVGFYSGVDWISADDKTKVMNVNYWCKIESRI